MAAKRMFYAVCFVLCVVHTQAQTNVFHKHYLSSELQSLVFLSDSTLIIEQGLFRLWADTNNLPKNNTPAFYATNAQIRSQKKYYSYHINKDVLYLERTPSSAKEIKEVFEVRYNFTHTNDLVLDFSGAPEIHPSFSLYRKLDSRILAFKPLIESELNSELNVVHYNSNFKITRTGYFEYQGFGNITKTGKLSKAAQLQIFGILNVLPKQSNQCTSVPIIDGTSAMIKIEYPNAVFQMNGSVRSQPLIFQELYRSMDAIIDSLANSIVHTNLGWLDASQSSCLFWYRNGLITYQEIPWVYMQWGGKVRHKLTVIDTNVTRVQQHIDYVIYVDELPPGQSWGKNNGINPETLNERQRKKLLSTIYKTFANPPSKN